MSDTPLTDAIKAKLQQMGAIKSEAQQTSIMEEIRKKEDAEWDQWISEIEQRVFHKEIAKAKAMLKESHE